MGPPLEATLAAHHESELLAEVRDLAHLAKIHFIREKEPLGLGHAVLCARQHVGDEPFAVLLGDDIIRADRPAIRQLLDRYEEIGHAVVAVERVPANIVDRYGVVRPEEIRPGFYQALDVVEKPAPAEAPSDLAVVGRYVLTPDVFDYLEGIAPGAGGEIQLTDALRRLAADGRLFAAELEGVRYDVGDRLGFLRATVEFALERADLAREFAAMLRELAAELDSVPTAIWRRRIRRP